MADGLNFACIRGELSAKGIAEGVIDELEETYNRLRNTYPLESHDRISARLLDIVQNRRYRRVSLASTQARAQANIQAFVNGGADAKEQARRLIFVMSRDLRQRDLYANNFENIRQLIIKTIDAQVVDSIQQLSPRWFHQVQNRALTDEVGEVIFGRTDGVSEQGKVMGKAVRKMFDDIRTRFNAYGLKIGEMENFFPSPHNASRIRKAAGAFGSEEAAVEAWLADVKRTNDFSQKINRDTGEVFTEEELDEVLRKIHKTIVSDGMEIYEAFNIANPKTYIERMEQERFFVWKDYQSWKTYQEKYGNGGNLMEALALYRNGVSRDLAILHTLGTDPVGTVTWMKNTATNLLGKNEATDIVNRLDKEWKVISGEFARPESKLLASGNEITKTLVRLATLGGSGLASLLDLNFASQARWYYGLSTSTQVPDFFRDIKAFYTRGDSPRLRQQLKGGMGGETMLAGLIGNSKAMGEFVGPRIMHRANDAFFRANMTMPITEAARNSNEVATAIGLRSIVEDGLDSADPRLRDVMQRYGITQESLDQIKGDKYKLEFGEGYGINLPAIVEDFGIDAAAPYQAILQDIRDMSSPAPSVELRTFFAEQEGTLKAAVWSSFTMFWQFPMAAWQTQVLRRLHNNPPKTAAGQLAALTAIGTMAGAFIVQSRQILNGKEPMEWEDPKLWLSAFTMSGVAGVWGDYLANLVHGGEFTKAFAGPVFGGPVAGAAATISAAVSRTEGEDVSVVSPAIRTLRSITPGMNFPLFGLAIQRLIYDQIRIMLDDDAYRYFRNRARRMERETGQQEWWRSGRTEPEFAR